MIKNFVRKKIMIENIFISVPIDYLFSKSELEMIKKYKFNLELKIFSTHLDEYRLIDFIDINAILKKMNLKCTFHAPFIDMSPGSFDEKIRKITLERFIKILDVASIFKPVNIVYHTGFMDVIQGWFFDMWIEKSCETWKEVLNYCKKINQKISIENVFEKNTATAERLISELNNNLIGICLDVGHHNVFAEIEIEEWFKKFKSKIFEIHLHDNDGTFDWHRAVGEGNIDFKKILKLAKKYSPDAILTLEAHDKDTMLLTYERTKKILEKL